MLTRTGFFDLQCQVEHELSRHADQRTCHGAKPFVAVFRPSYRKIIQNDAHVRQMNATANQTAQRKPEQNDHDGNSVQFANNHIAGRQNYGRKEGVKCSFNRLRMKCRIRSGTVRDHLPHYGRFCYRDDAANRSKNTENLQ